MRRLSKYNETESDAGGSYTLPPKSVRSKVSTEAKTIHNPSARYVVVFTC